MATVRKMVKVVPGCKSHGKGLLGDRGSGGRKSQNIFSSFAKVMTLKKRLEGKATYFGKDLKRYD